jgi:O-antigen/teichoic acid export membrane protein
MSTVAELSEPKTRVVGQSAAPDTALFRRHVGQISRQSSVFFAGTVFTTALGYVFRVYLARALGPESLGLYALGMTIVGFLGIFNAFGLPQSAVRFVSSYTGTAQVNHLRTFLWRGTALLLIGNVVLGGIFLWSGPLIARRFYHTPALTRYLYFFVLIMFLGALTGFFAQVLAGYKDVTRRTLITNFVGTPSTMVLTVALLSVGAGLRGYLFAQVVSSVLVLLLLLWSIWNITPPQARLWTGPWADMDSEVVAFSSTVFGIGILEFCLAQADKVLIGYYLNVREVGIYAIAAALVGFVAIALQSVNQIFTPTIADLHGRGEFELLQRLYQTLTKWILGLTLPLATWVIIFAAPLMGIFGADFKPGWPILVIGTVGQLVNCGVGSVGYLLLMSGNQRRLLKVQASMGILMLVLGSLLIPLWGIVGAAVAAAVVNVVTNAWSLREVRSSLGLSPYNASYLRLLPPFLASAVALLALKRFAPFWQPQWALILISLVMGYCVFVCVALAAGLNGDDQLIASAIWARARGSFQQIVMERS